MLLVILPEDVQFPKVRREVVEFQSIDDLSTCFENNTYYVPKGPNFPLLDAFVVDLDRLEIGCSVGPAGAQITMA